MQLRSFWGWVICGTLGSLGLFWLTNIPLGIPGEWVWPRYEFTADVIANVIMTGVVGLVYVGFVAWGLRSLADPQRLASGSLGWLLGLGLLSGLWIWTVQGTGGSGPTIARWPFVLYYQSSSGYFHKARYESPAANVFLREYEDLMLQGDVLHVGTHPPGLFLFFHGLIAVLHNSPECVTAINQTIPRMVQETFQIIQQNSEDALRRGKSPVPPLNELDRAVLWLAALICFGCTALTVWPLYGFLRFYTDRSTSWLCAATWPLIPAASIFMPKSDVAYAFFAMLLGWMWIAAWRKSSPWLAAATGVVWSMCLLCSLAFLPVALWLAILSVCESWQSIDNGSWNQEAKRALWTIVPAAVAVFLGLGVVCYCGEIPLWNTFWLNYKNHAGFYAQYPRTYWKWLLVNPLELACSLGWPVAVASVWGLCTGLSQHRAARWRSFWSPCFALMVVWGWLWISGKNSGEAARLWVFLMPFWVSCCAGNPLPMFSEHRSDRWPISAMIWLSLQAVVCCLTVHCINGFSFAG